MSISTTLDRVGRIVLPSEIRRRLGLAPGARLRLEIVAERIE
ncbi:MAG: AbrB/MazE/SpoVT family DNA-binding domain-containing protein, partial [Acidobacteria bacterium]|nr:AbrB/MazE/SpoVT family DNA-binding domain-containing protein [Acidobacteriota bacterium]